MPLLIRNYRRLEQVRASWNCVAGEIGNTGSTFGWHFSFFLPFLSCKSEASCFDALASRSLNLSTPEEYFSRDQDDSYACCRRFGFDALAVFSSRCLGFQDLYSAFLEVLVPVMASCLSRLLAHRLNFQTEKR